MVSAAKEGQADDHELDRSDEEESGQKQPIELFTSPQLASAPPEKPTSTCPPLCLSSRLSPQRRVARRYTSH